MKHLIDQLRDPVRERHARQGGASAKHSIAQLCEPVRERHARQGGARVKRKIAQLREPVWEHHTRQRGAMTKHFIAQLRDFSTSLEIDAEEGFTPIEGSLFFIVPNKILIPDDCDIGVPDDEGDGSFTERQ